MIVKSISIVGFRGATKSLTLDFDPNKSLILIFGENGTGKSTIADAFDFLCNRCYGSLEKFSLREPAKNFIPSFRMNPSEVKVTITSTDSNWTATLGKEGAIVEPEQDAPDAHILRRKTILELIDAQPKERFEALKTFIEVPAIEKSENALRESVRNVGKTFDENTKALAQATEQLEKLWDREGRPETSALKWAESEATKDVGTLKKNIEQFDFLLKSVSEIREILGDVERKRGSFKTAETAVLEARKNQEAEEVKDLQIGADLLKLFEEAVHYLSKHKDLEKCPLCENLATAPDLLEKLQNKIQRMRQLQALVRAVEEAQKNLDKAIVVLNHSEEILVEKGRNFSSTLSSAELPEVVYKSFERAKYPELSQSLGSIEDTESFCRKFISQESSFLESCQKFRDQDQKSITLQNTLLSLRQSVSEKNSQAKSQEKLYRKMKEIYDLVSGSRKKYVDEILEKISDEVQQFYSQLHPGEGYGAVKLYLKQKAIGSLEFDAQFHGVSELPPQAYYSESHLDTLGISVFLALAKHFKRSVVLLDDVLSSVDAEHLDRFMKLLHEQARHLGQVLVTTHYRPWRDRYRWARGPAANTQLIELGPWTLLNGIRSTEFLTELDELRNLTLAGTVNRQAISSKAGIVLESLLDFLTLKYFCRVPRNSRNEYTLGDLSQGIDSRLGGALLSRKHPVAGAQIDTPLKPLIDSATAITRVRNQVGCHFSINAEVTNAEIIAFSEATIHLADALICSGCKSLPLRRPTGSHWQCTCGALEMHPLVNPSDPSRIADDI